LSKRSSVGFRVGRMCCERNLLAGVGERASPRGDFTQVVPAGREGISDHLGLA
jgi:hypothetical protein